MPCRPSASIRAYVSACGGDPDDWALRRSLAEQSIESEMWLPFSFEDFFPLGERWVRTALAPLSLVRGRHRGHLPGDAARPSSRCGGWDRNSAGSCQRPPFGTAAAGSTLCASRPLWVRRRPDQRIPDIAEEVAEEASARDLLKDLSQSGETDHQAPRGRPQHPRDRPADRPAGADGQEPPPPSGDDTAGFQHTRTEESHPNLRAYLGVLRRRAGMPSLRWIAARIGYKSHPGGGRPRRRIGHPSWRFTERYVHVLNGAPEHARFLWEQLHAEREVRQPASYSDVAAKSGRPLRPVEHGRPPRTGGPER